MLKGKCPSAKLLYIVEPWFLGPGKFIQLDPSLSLDSLFGYTCLLIHMFLYRSHGSGRTRIHGVQDGDGSVARSAIPHELVAVARHYQKAPGAHFGSHGRQSQAHE
jgi:hypothetical protein